LAPFYKQLEKLSRLTIRDKKDEVQSQTKLDERLFATPAVAVGQATEVTYEMAETAINGLKKSLRLFDNYDLKEADEIRSFEDRADKYEDSLGDYLVKLSSENLSEAEAIQVTKLLHIIGDLERISDHSVNIVESAEEMKDKKLQFSPQANLELSVIRSALDEILDITKQSLLNNDIMLAAEVEPLEEVVDRLRDKIKLHHIIRLQKSECTIEHGFVLSDLLNNLERVSDHCSNIAGCVIEMSTVGSLDMHKYKTGVIDSIEFKQKVVYYEQKYNLAN
jgi:phosphate:Na+ symporter